MQADAKHEKDDAQLGQLADGVRVADETRGERTDDDAGQQVADDRGQAETAHEHPTDERYHQCGGDIDQQR